MEGIVSSIDYVNGWEKAIDIAYCMAQFENRIRRENNSAKIYLECVGRVDQVYERMISRWSTMIDSFEAAFGVDYF
jgi:hypothetical protein